ncbi:MAG: hypothetical protein AMK73_03540 [Planctomycetes bacterium SM23_32]|nr:MAG: hypothetical protein AMK73_03540 [Planctomycetes bacterium SM23_32]
MKARQDMGDRTGRDAGDPRSVARLAPGDVRGPGNRSAVLRTLRGLRGTLGPYGSAVGARRARSSGNAMEADGRGSPG